LESPFKISQKSIKIGTIVLTLYFISGIFSCLKKIFNQSYNIIAQSLKKYYPGKQRKVQFFRISLHDVQGTMIKTDKTVLPLSAHCRQGIFVL